MGDLSQVSTPLYLDWQFWAAILAAIAIILSQLPPVILWFKPRRLEVEVHSRLVVTHKVGNPNLGLFLGLRNTGGRQVWVKSMRLTISRDGQGIGIFPAQNFFETPTSQTPILFVPFSLRVGDGWFHTTNFLNFFDRQTERAYRAAETALRADIQAKLAARPEGDKAPVEAAEALVAPFMATFNRLFVWQPGEYEMELAIDTDSSERAFHRRYRFTLFESDSAELRSHTDDYKFGGGLAYNVDRHIGVLVQLTANDG
jgi:hypothetical protein